MFQILKGEPFPSPQSPKGRLQTVQELDFIISRLYTPVNVFISKHLWKTQINPEKSSDKSL